LGGKRGGEAVFSGKGGFRPKKGFGGEYGGHAGRVSAVYAIKKKTERRNSAYSKGKVLYSLERGREGKFGLIVGRWRREGAG